MAIQAGIHVKDGIMDGAYAAQAKNVSYGNGTVEGALDNVIEKLDNITENLLAGTIGSGSTILSKVTDSSFPTGVSLWYTQHAEDSPVKATVSFTIVNKPLANGAYSSLYLFANANIYQANWGSTIPQSISWTKIV